MKLDTVTIAPGHAILNGKRIPYTEGAMTVDQIQSAGIIRISRDEETE